VSKSNKTEMILTDQREFSNDGSFAVRTPGGGKRHEPFASFGRLQKKALGSWSYKNIEIDL
jgi:hypothetical protein